MQGEYDMCEDPAEVNGFKRLPGTDGKTYCFEYSYVTDGKITYAQSEGYKKVS